MGTFPLDSLPLSHAAPLRNCQPDRAVKRPFEGTTEAPVWKHTLRGWGPSSMTPISHYISNLYVAVSPAGIIHETGNHRIDIDIPFLL